MSLVSVGSVFGFSIVGVATFLTSSVVAYLLNQRFLRSYFALMIVDVPNLEQALRMGEGQTVEFKRGLSDEWLSVQRIFDSWTDDELEAYVTQGCLPANPFNRARPLHGSLDGMDRNALMKLWEEHERAFRGQGLEQTAAEQLVPDVYDHLTG